MTGKLTIKSQEVLNRAKEIADIVETWADFSNLMFDQKSGIVASIFPDMVERRKFYNSEEYQEVQDILTELMRKHGVVAGSNPTTKEHETDDIFENIDIYETAKESLKCAASWEEDARLIGNVRAGDIAKMCKYLIAHLEEENPVFLLTGIPVLLWFCPNGCGAEVEWSKDNIATCLVCGETSKKDKNE